MAGARNTPRRDARSAVRRKTILDLRVEGLTFEAIGTRLGITKQAAHEALQKELAEAATERRASAHLILDEQIERVRFVLRSLAPKVAKGDSKAATAFLRAMEREAKLLGLDAPERHEVAGTLTTDPAALHAHLGAIAARAALEADADAASPPERDGTS